MKKGKFCAAVLILMLALCGCKENDGVLSSGGSAETQSNSSYTQSFEAEEAQKPISGNSGVTKEETVGSNTNTASVTDDSADYSSISQKSEAPENSSYAGTASAGKSQNSTSAKENTVSDSVSSDKSNTSPDSNTVGSSSKNENSGNSSSADTSSEEKEDTNNSDNNTSINWEDNAVWGPKG